MPAETDPEFEPGVDPRLCIGCDLCPRILPEVFTMADHRGVAYVHDADGWRPDKADQLREAQENCPVNAITIEPEG